VQERIFQLLNIFFEKSSEEFPELLWRRYARLRFKLNGTMWMMKKAFTALA